MASVAGAESVNVLSTSLRCTRSRSYRVRCSLDRSTWPGGTLRCCEAYSLGATAISKRSTLSPACATSTRSFEPGFALSAMPTNATHSSPSRITSTRSPPSCTRGACSEAPRPILATPPGTADARGSVAAQARAAHADGKSAGASDRRNRRRLMSGILVQLVASRSLSGASWWMITPSIGVAALLLGQVMRELADDVAQAVDLLVASDVAVGAARVLDVLLPAEHVPDRLRLGAFRLPDVDAEDDRVATGVVVEHRFDRRVRVDAAVPVRLIVDRDRGKRGRQRAGGHHVLEGERLLVAGVVEVAQLAALHVDRADGEARALRLQQLEVDERRERRVQRLGPVPRRVIHAKRRVHAAPGNGARHEEAGNAADVRRQVGVPVVRPGPDHRLDPAPEPYLVPELEQARQALFGRVAGDDRAVDGADRGADDPVGLDARLVQRLVDADLVGAERAAALQHEDDLARDLLAAARSHLEGHGASRAEVTSFFSRIVCRVDVGDAPRPDAVQLDDDFLPRGPREVIGLRLHDHDA